MSTSSEKLDVIRKLLAKSEGTDNPHEAQVFAEKAADLMARYAIDEALVRAPVADDPIGEVIWTVEAPYVSAKQGLITAIARPCNLFTITSGDTMIVVGRRSDVERADFLYTHLLVQANRIMVTLQARNLRAYRRAWLIGFAAAIYQRMRETTEEVVAEGEPGTALVLADRKAAAEAYARNLYPNLRKARTSRVDSRGYAAGKAAGQRADVGNARVGHTRGAIR